jgi:hypothetical protein
MPRADAMMLSDLATQALTIACAPCNRRGVHSVARLIAKRGDARLTELRVFLSVDCAVAAEPSATPTWKCSVLSLAIKKLIVFALAVV